MMCIKDSPDIHHLQGGLHGSRADSNGKLLPVLGNIVGLQAAMVVQIAVSILLVDHDNDGTNVCTGWASAHI